jgi:hypothetical protein
MVAGCLLQILIMPGLRAAAADPDLISTPEVTIPARYIPILTSTDAASNSADHFQVTVSPLTVTRAPGATGDFADSANENVDAGWHLPLFSMFTIGYDTGVNAFRQDQTIWDDEEATSQVTTAFFTKPGIEIQAGPAVKWTGYVQGQRSFTGDVPGYADSTKYGTEAAWTPVKDVTTMSVDASTQETRNFNGSILDSNLYTASVDQKLPYIPVTLHTAGSITDDTSPSPLLTDSNSTVVDASLLWKIVAGASASVGYQRQDTTIPVSVTLQNTDTCFTQLSVQASQDWTVTMRAAHDDKAATQAGQFLSNGSDDVLSIGLTWKLGDRFTAGAGVNYRVLQSQTPAPAANTPPTTVSLSAGGNF